MPRATLKTVILSILVLLVPPRTAYRQLNDVGTPTLRAIQSLKRLSTAYIATIQIPIRRRRQIITVRKPRQVQLRLAARKLRQVQLRLTYRQQRPPQRRNYVRANQESKKAIQQQQVIQVKSSEIEELIELVIISQTPILIPRIKPPTIYYAILSLSPRYIYISSILRTLSTSISLATDGGIELYSLVIVVGSIIVVRTAIASLLYIPIGIRRRSSYQAAYLLRIRRYRKTTVLSGFRYIRQIRTILRIEYSQQVRIRGTTTIASILQAYPSIVDTNEASASAKYYYVTSAIGYYLLLRVLY